MFFVIICGLISSDLTPLGKCKQINLLKFSDGLHLQFNLVSFPLYVFISFLTEQFQNAYSKSY